MTATTLPRLETRMDLWSAFAEWLQARTFLDAAEFFFVTLTVIGQRFNAGRDVRGYYFWVTSNVCAVILFASLGRWMSVLLYAYLAGECIRGIIVWRRLDAAKAQNPERDHAGGARLTESMGQARAGV